MKKYLSLILAVLLVLAMFTGCTPKKKTTIKICTIADPTGIGMVGLMAEDEAGSSANDYSFTVVSSPDNIIAKLASGEADIATIPTNLAAIYNKKTHGDARVLAVNTLCDLSILENGNTIKTIADLKGKTIYTTGRGTNSDYIFKYILRKNGLDPEKDVVIEYLFENEELFSKMRSGSATIALASEPIATTVMIENSKIRKALDVAAEWGKVSGDSQLVMGCVVTSKEFIEKNKTAVNAFLKEYKTSVNSALHNTDSTAALCEKYKIIPSAAIAKKAIPNCNLVYSDGSDMKTKLSGYLKVLYKANRTSVGGVLPGNDFYYKK